MDESLTRRRRKEIASLTQKKYRERLGQTLVEGVRSVGSALDAGAPLVDILVGASVVDDDEVRRLVSRAGVPVYVVADAELAAISAVETSQGMLAVAEIRTSTADALRSATHVLVLDGLQDPGNAGTIIRTAAWFGVRTLITAPGTVDLYNPKVVRATMGALWDIAHVQVDDLPGTLREMRSGGHVIYAAEMGGSDVRSWRPAENSVLVLGSEGHGISPEVGALVHERVAIPGASTREGTESLNVAIAAAILLYEWVSTSP